MFQIKKDQKTYLIADESINLKTYSKDQFDIIFNSIDSDIVIDLTNLKEYDSFTIYLIKEIYLYCQEHNYNCEFKSFSDDFINIYNKLSNYKKHEEKEKSLGLKALTINIGKEVQNIINDIKSLVEFIGNILINSINLILFRDKVNLQEIGFLTLKNGVNALPIILLILLLIGLISGYQGALQLKQFGADIFIADLIGVSVTRELSPLMVAIIVAGRSGSAFTAEIGTMKISDEVDALKTMNFNIYNYLVMPRIIALIFSVPILCLIGDLAGIIGGLIAGMTTLDLTMNAYFTELKTALTYAGIFSGVFKSFVFALTIAIIGCFRGLQVSGGAESVGRYTTSSVVTSIFLIILLDAVFTYTFQIFGI